MEGLPRFRGELFSAKSRSPLSCCSNISRTCVVPQAGIAICESTTGRIGANLNRDSLPLRCSRRNSRHSFIARRTIRGEAAFHFSKGRPTCISATSAIRSACGHLTASGPTDCVPSRRDDDRPVQWVEGFEQILEDRLDLFGIRHQAARDVATTAGFA